ncbi:MAG: hypothetical protein WKG07_17705 [Hymenobacter sp.]
MLTPTEYDQLDGLGMADLVRTGQLHGRRANRSRHCPRRSREPAPQRHHPPPV